VSAPLLSALLLLAPPTGLPAEQPAPVAPTTPAARPADHAPAATTAPGAVPELRLPRGGLEPSALAAPGVLLAGLAAAALVLRRRRRPSARRVQVLETTSLGPKRSLVLARFEDELLLLGASEAGIQLLRHRPGTEARAPAAALAEAPDFDPPPLPAREPPGVLAGLVTKLRRVRPETAQAPRFDALLAESAEDQELRRKLARGQGGSVR
jgi:flagellar protein FliO/FliZ